MLLGYLLTMNIHLLAFGQVAEITGFTRTGLQDVKNSDELTKFLHTNYPNLSSTSFSIAVNKKLVHGFTEFMSDDTIALLPPFSGG